MENSRTNVALSPGVWTNVYSSASIGVGAKLGIQNLSSDPVIVFFGTSPTTNKGFTVNPLDYFSVPSGVSGCFVQTVTQEGGVLAVELDGYSLPGLPFDERVYSGLKGLTTQPFIEANVKNSTQWEFSSLNSSLGAGLFQDAIFLTGALPVIIKNRQITFSGSGITAQVFESPTYTGGTLTTLYNLNRITPNSPQSTIRVGVTTSVVGTEIAAPTYSIGAATQAPKTVGTFLTTGVERILKPNTPYLLRITNNDTSACKVGIYTTFYEGELSNQN